jgi:hypothetical protein
MCGKTGGAPGNERAQGEVPLADCPGCDRPCTRFAELGKIVAALDRQPGLWEGTDREVRR